MSDIWADIDVRITDQRIGMGVGGINTIMRVQHIPTGIVVEVPSQGRSPHKVREVAKTMIEFAVMEFGP